MTDPKSKWTERVLRSTQGMNKVHPREGLFDQIVGKLEAPAAKVLTLKQRRLVAAAVVAIIMLNIFAVRTITSNGTVINQPSSQYSYQTIVMNYNIYNP